MKKIILIVFVFYFADLHAQFKRPFFNTLSVENGLPEGYVQASLQDKLGYLWFGTQNGLVRYDGYTTKIYPLLAEDNKLLSTPSIRYIFEDKHGILWILLSDYGYFIYDRHNDVFKRPKSDNAEMINASTGTTTKFVYDKINDVGWRLIFDRTTKSWSVELLDLHHETVDLFSSKSMGRNKIPAIKRRKDIIVDSSGNTWLATDSLLNIYDKTSKSFKPFFMLPAGMNKIIFNEIMQDPVNTDLLWIATDLSDSSQDVNKVKIIQLNIKTKDYKTYDHIASDPNSIAGYCYEIYIDSLKRIFFYTNHGLSMYNRENDEFTNYLLTVPDKQAKEPIWINSIAADKEGNLWIGGSFNGLFFLNSRTAVATFYTHTDEVGSLPDCSRSINKIFFDRAGVLWVSMPWNGIAWLDPKRSFFNPIKINSPVKEANQNSSAISNNIAGVYNDSTFFVSSGKNIFIWNHATNDFKNIDPAEGKREAAIGTTITDKEGLIWMTSFGDGLYCYNPKTKTTKNYKNDSKDSTSIGSNKLSKIKEDNDGNLWIGTGDNGLNSFNKKTGKFTRYPFIENNGNIKAINVLDDDQVINLLFGKDGILWIGTNNGSLNRFDTKTGKFTSYMDTKEGLVCIVSIYEDSRNRMWAGGYLSGLFLVNRDSGFINHFTEEDGLSSNDVRGITEDKKGNIWLATSHGLSRLDPVTNQITNYTTINGLPVVKTSGIYKGSDGLFYISIKNGVIPFDPDNIPENKIAPEVVLESIKYHVAGNTANNMDTVLFTEGRQEVELKYNENKITFQYVGLHFVNAALNQYAYKLDGYDKNWIQAGTQRTATYTNLSSGTYTFKVKASNSDGVWNETGASFTFTILPPWWKTWWAYSMYFFIITGSIWYYIKWREKSLKESQRVLEQTVTKRTAEVVAEKKEADRQRQRSDELLLNILPAEMAEELKANGTTKAKSFTMVTVMFTDFKDFTTVSEKVSAELLVDEIHHCFSAFDRIIQKYKIEKIKTIGDSYMCASGLPVSNYTHAKDMVNAALEIRNFMLERKKEKEVNDEIPFELRIGIHTGPVVAGIVGIKKFAYDIWGDTVNLAARMEQNSDAGKVNISGSTYELVKDKFNCVHRGKIQAKNKGDIDMYFVEAVS